MKPSRVVRLCALKCRCELRMCAALAKEDGFQHGIALDRCKRIATVLIHELTPAREKLKGCQCQDCQRRAMAAAGANEIVSQIISAAKAQGASVIEIAVGSKGVSQTPSMPMQSEQELAALVARMKAKAPNN